jgi:hypothetical protein
MAAISRDQIRAQVSRTRDGIPPSLVRTAFAVVARIRLTSSFPLKRTPSDEVPSGRGGEARPYARLRR